jgi:hypothetical protein
MMASRKTFLARGLCSIDRKNLNLATTTMTRATANMSRRRKNRGCCGDDCDNSLKSTIRPAKVPPKPLFMVELLTPPIKHGEIIELSWMGERGAGVHLSCWWKE